MVIRLKDGVDGVLFLDEKAVNAIYFKTKEVENPNVEEYIPDEEKWRNGKGIRYFILVYGSKMTYTEFEFQTKELYDEALNTWIEYEKIKVRPSYLMNIDLNKGD